MPKHIETIETYLSLSASELADSSFACPRCGRNHAVPIRTIRNETGIARALPDIAAGILGKAPRKAALLYDVAIEELVRRAVVDELPALAFDARALGRAGKLLDSDASLGDEIVRGLSRDVDIVVAAGSGVVADLGKWVATKAGRPLIIYGTAPSMNAYTSITATMTVEGIKTSAWLAPAAAVLMDPELSAAAPKEMILAGMGDLSARSICNADWKLAELLAGKYFCSLPFLLTEAIEKSYLGSAPGIGRGEIAALGVLGEAILVSGISMTMVEGETSPSSGAEHVFSHYWDLQVELEGAPKNLHGTQVGIGTMLSFALFDYLRGVDVSCLDARTLVAKRPSIEALKAEHRAKFRDKAHFFDEVLERKWIPDGEYAPRLERIVADWERIWGELAPYVGNGRAVRESLESAGFAFSLETIGRTRRQAIDALVYGNRYRSRYTMLDLAWELGVLPGAADEILDRSGLV
jgi:glycerol-1-phosphate dehydrogenase [NAD(P)+]